MWPHAARTLQRGLGLTRDPACNCWDATVGRYLAALVKVEAFPLEWVFSKHSANTALERLDEFKFDWEG
jgi:hypothetical protein